jgi:predicted secreted protein
MAEIDLSESDNGRSIRVRPGDAIVLRLGQVAGAGYAWIPVSTADELLTLTASASTPTALGGGKESVLTFKAMRPGTGTIELAYRRPWEPPTAAEKRFRLDVAVGGESG